MSVPNTSELDDDQIEALIRKLSAIKGSAPELIAALEAEANSRLAASKSSSKGRSGARGRNNNNNNNTPRPSRSHSYEEEEVEEEEEDDDDDETDSEEDDEFDDDGPCVGYGYSDEVSVISEMTTPTVVSSIHVPAEERYEEMHGKRNKPDLLSQVNRVNAAKMKKPLNSEKRKTYTSGLAAMAKISETAETAAVTKPTKTSTSTPRATKKQPQRKQSGDEKVVARSSAKPSSTRGIRRDNSPSRGGTTSTKTKKDKTGKKSNHSSGSVGGTKTSTKNRKESDHADAFGGDDWHKSLTAGDFNASSGMDDNGFPFSFADTDNAFANSTSSFFQNKKSSKSSGKVSAEETTDPFDPFSTGDPFKSTDAFDTNNNAFANNASSGSGKSKTKATGSRPRRSSGMQRESTRSKRDQSPRRKGGAR